MSAWIGSATSQTFTFMPASTLPSRSQNVTKEPFAGSPRWTMPAPGPARPEYSIPSSYWSVKKYGTRS
jgi:hypothetical protein